MPHSPSRCWRRAHVMAPACLMSCSGFGPPLETPADPDLARVPVAAQASPVTEGGGRRAAALHGTGSGAQDGVTGWWRTGPLWNFTVKFPPYCPGWCLPCACVETLAFRGRDEQEPQRPDHAGTSRDRRGGHGGHKQRGWGVSATGQRLVTLPGLETKYTWGSCQQFWPCRPCASQGTAG